MKKFIYTIVFLLSISCANNASKTMEIEASETFEIEEQEEEQSDFSENDAYTLLVTQKLQEYIDLKALAKANPDFTIDTNENKLLSIEEGIKLKNINFISPFEAVSDSVKKAITRVVMNHKVDTILTFIKTSEIEIDGELLINTKVSFDTIQKK